MAGSMALIVADEQQTSSVDRATRWEIQYSRFFCYISPIVTCTSNPSSLSSIRRGHFRGTWLSSATPTAILSLCADRSLSDFILTVSLHGKILEQHYASKLHFSLPQLSCMPNVPQQRSQVVFASYKDGDSELQKFGLRFSTHHEAGDFLTILEDSVSNKQYFEDFLTATRSSQSEAKDMFSEEVPAGASQILYSNPVTSYQTNAQQFQEVKHSHSKDIAANYSSEGYRPNISEGYVPEISEGYVPQISEGYVEHANEGDAHNASESYAPVFPPRFTSLVANCSEMARERGDVATGTVTVTHEVDLKSLIAQYLQDASFLDILSKAEEVIAELGDGMTIQHFL